MGIDKKKLKTIVSASVLPKITRVVKIKINFSSRFCANLEFTQLNQHTFYIIDLHFLGSGNPKPDIFVVNSTKMSILHDLQHRAFSWPVSYECLRIKTTNVLK